ncbi:GNAT family N-acetyltransferase [Azospirillum sp. A39]|uniref:GNAT family N-acetyltransferase n=1 Tax=Azospirillum sp. A39 TaxID=3462279 RepID=UPI0040457ABA
MDRLVADWEAGNVRFTREGERLLSAHVEEELAGIGGVTVDPATMGALRMRHFYIRQPFRRLGIGRNLARSLLDRSRPLTCRVTVNAGSADAAAFWEALGFAPDPCDGHTHILHPGMADGFSIPVRR